MLIRFCSTFSLLLLFGLSAADYQYKAVQHVNQMEPPSLETASVLVGQNEAQKVHVLVRNAGAGGGGGGGNAFGGFQGGGRQAAPPNPGFSSYSADSDEEGGKNCKKNRISSRSGPMHQSSEEAAEAEIREATDRLNNRCNKHNGPMSRSMDTSNSMTENYQMLDRKQEQSPMQEIKRIHLRHSDLIQEETDLKPNIREKVETFTETYVVTSMATRVVTRKRVFMQKRRVINQKINKPILIVRRKLIKERQIFERIIPKIIETREIINNPSVKSKILEGPIYEVSDRQGPRSRALPRRRKRPQSRAMVENPPPEEEEEEGDCPEVEFDPNSGLETMDASNAVGGSDTGYKYLG